MKLRASLLFAAFLLFVSALALGAGPVDTQINVKYGPIPLAMPYNAMSGYAVTGARQVAVSTIGNNFSAAVRGDMSALSGGLYDASTQTGYFAFNAQNVMNSQGQGIGYFAFMNGLGKGNALFGNGVIECYGGGEVHFPSGTPECGAIGEYESDQGASIFAATLTTPIAPGATTLNYLFPVNEAVAGGRAILNLNQNGGAGGILSSFTGCVQGSAPPCPGTCAAGVGSTCTVITFTGNPLVGLTTAQGWYFKTGSTNDYYAPACVGDDVQFPNGGVPKCVGHWWRVSTIDSSNQLTLFAAFDTSYLAQPTGTSNYMLLQGIEALNVNTTTHQAILPANTTSWANTDLIYSPPDQFMGIIGANLIFTKEYKTGGAGGAAQSEGIKVFNQGPAQMDFGLLVTGAANDGTHGGFRTGIEIENLGILTSGGAGTITNNTRAINVPENVNYILVANSGSFSGGIATNVLALGNNADAMTFHNNTHHTLEFLGVPVEVGTGVYGDGGGLKHARSGTGAITANTIASVTLSWATAFVDTNYTATCSILDPTGKLLLNQLTATGTGGIVMNVQNTDLVSSRAGTVECHAMHD
jgi:hypothetical protein